MKTIFLLLFAFLLFTTACNEPEDFSTEINDDMELKSANKNSTVVTHEVWDNWGLPVVCDTNDDPMSPEDIVDQLCTCDGETLNAVIRTHYDKKGLIDWQHITFSGSMKSVVTGEIFKIPNYTMKWYYSEEHQDWPASWELHFTAIGEWGTKYIGAGTMNTITWEGETLRIKCK